MKRTFAAALLAVSLAAGSGVSRAEEPHAQDPIVVLVYRPGDVFGLRLEAELRSIGVRVVTRRRHSRLTPEGTVAVATLSDKPPRRVEIRMGNHPSPLVAPDVVVDVDGAGLDVPGIQTSERVRAAFEPLAPKSAPPPTDEDPPPLLAPPAPFSPAPPALPRAAPPGIVARPPPPLATGAPELQVPVDLPPLRPIAERPWFGVGVGFGATLATQGAGLETTASVFFAPTDWFRVEPFLMIPLRPVTFEAAAGRADLYAGALGARAAFTLWSGSIVSMAVGGGLAGLWLRAEGDANTGFVGSTEDGLAAAALADLRCRIRIAGPFLLAPRATLGFALPPAKVVFDGTTVGTWGLPFGALDVAAEIEWAP